MERPSFPVQGERLRWTALPEKVRKGVEQLLGGTVAHAESHSGGFSPGCATRVDLEDGSWFFVKAAGPLPNSDTPEIHRAEAKIAAALPSLRFVPKFLGKYDDGTWVALAYDYIDGHSPRIPWRREELDRVLVALEDLSRILTPAPINAPRIEQKHVPFLQGWRKTLRERTETGHALRELDPWVGRNLRRLARLETEWPHAARGRLCYMPTSALTTSSSLQPACSSLIGHGRASVHHGLISWLCYRASTCREALPHGRCSTNIPWPGELLQNRSLSTSQR